MSDCGFPRPLLEAWLSGEGTPEESGRVEVHLSSCEGCRESLGPVVLGVGLLFLTDPAGASPSTGFAGRVMDRIRAEGVDDDAPPVEEAPGRPGPRAEGVDDDAPPSPVRPSLPGTGQGRLLHLPRPVWAGIGAAAAVAAAAGWLLLTGDPGTTVVSTDPGVIKESKSGSVAARDGGVLRWTGPFDGVLAGSVWVAKDAAVPTSAGELLHSPASSSFLTRLPGGGRLDAGPSSWLVVGGPGEAAVLAGGFTGIADGGISLSVETPAGRVTVPADGEVEISIGAATGGGPKDAGMVWLGAFAASRRGMAAPALAPDPPPVVQVIYARRGSIEVAASGPVRNSLERRTLRQGQALVIIESKVFLSEGVDDDGPPDSSRWMDGLPVPPGSKFFRTGRRPVEEPAVPPGGFGATSGPVRNSLERSLADPKTTPEERAYALSVYESMGGPEAIAAGVKAVDDPAIEVRCAALHLLAVTASADRPAALAGLRRLAQDDDDFIARFAILALKTLRDMDAIPVLRAIAVDDDAPPDAPKRDDAADGPVKHLVAKVYALDALVALGDTSLLREAAALQSAAVGTTPLDRVLQQVVFDILSTLPRPTVLALFDDPRPGVKAAALSVLQDQALARLSLQSQSTILQTAAAQVILGTKTPTALDAIGRLHWESPEAKTVILTGSALVLDSNPSLPVPVWLHDMAIDSTHTPDPVPAHVSPAIRILTRGNPVTLQEELLTSANSGTIASILSSSLSGFPFRLVARHLHSSDPAVRSAALSALLRHSPALASEDDADETIAVLDELTLTTYSDLRYKAILLGNFVQHQSNPAALVAFRRMTSSPNPQERHAAISVFSLVKDASDSARLLSLLLEDPDRTVAERAALSLTLAIGSNTWSGPPIGQFFPSPSPNPAVRVHIAIAAFQAHIPEALPALEGELTEANSRVRRLALVALTRLRTQLPRLDSAWLLDPDPEVRFRFISVSAIDQNISAISSLQGDPNVWVRATALSRLASNGFIDARTALAELHPVLLRQPGFAGGFLNGLPLDSPELPVIVEMAAGVAADQGTLSEEAFIADRATQAAMKTLHMRGLALSLQNDLAVSASGTTQESQYMRLGSIPCLESLSILALACDPDSPLAPSPRNAARSSLSSLLGFSPPLSGPDYHRVRTRGFISIEDVLAHSK